MSNQTTNAKIKKILSNNDFQKILARLSVQKGISQVQANIEAETYLQELFAEHDPSVNFGFIEIFQYLIGQGFDKNIDTDTAELKALSRLMRRHPVAFVLTHKSYIDLVVLMIVLARHGLPLPFLFAGINLDMPGVGKIVRNNGVIFIRRSFKDNIIYKAALRYYISWLLKQQSHFMWAIEGTRSRTGKLVWPQMGILKYIAEAEQDIRQQVKYVPVSIVYDLIPDVDDMTTETRGKKKKPETVKWMINYLRKMSSEKLGKISLRIGEPADMFERGDDLLNLPKDAEVLTDSTISRLAFRLIHKINKITPVTTVSLICNALLSKFSLTKRGVESNVSDLMRIIENHKIDALVDRGMPIGESVQRALNLLVQAGIVKFQGDGLHTKYTVNRDKYLQATYYANMSVHHLVHRSFIELALLKIIDSKSGQSQIDFWKEIMSLRDFFKFEFFYSEKDKFSSEIESELKYMLGEKVTNEIFNKKTNVTSILRTQNLLVAPVILSNYLEAYKVVAEGMLIWDPTVDFEEQAFVEYCLFLGEEMHWLGQINRVEAVSLPFLQNGIRLAKNLKIWPEEGFDKDKIIEFNKWVDNITARVNVLLNYTLEQRVNQDYHIPVEREIIPGTKTEKITMEILEGERGPHIGAFFDLDRTLINGFSAKNFVASRLLSGRFTSQELIAQFAGAISYARDTGNFGKMAAISANGVKGIDEHVFIQVGEEVYRKKLAEAIYPESRALVSAHIEMGHTVAIISAATPYQVEPIARDLCIDIVECTRLEVIDGKFTGKIIEPACWGAGKAIAGQKLVEKHHLNIRKSYFYTDSAEDIHLLEIVGNPRPVNPDTKLSGIAFQNDWPVLRYNDAHNSRIAGMVRTGLSLGVVIPAILNGFSKGTTNMSWNEGVESMMRSIGDLGTYVAGITLSIKGEEHLWSHRPAVFILNHQSNADMLIAIKLIRKEARGVAKMELKKMPVVGQILEASGTIFLDRTDKEKAIEALKPAIDSLKSGISIVIFPEGTRSYDYTLGSFKKGAFHIAMEAGVPIVPIVLKNAHDVMPRGKNIFNPALVEVIIHPPVLTHDWNKSNLDVKIREIRNLYLKDLKQPLDEVE
ncbi:MAG: HAD-IB family hydrolase [Saprospiraceae bacterium]|nr:HAD-IB family hydrolase [Saprospiraceae bacterium]